MQHGRPGLGDLRARRRRPDQRQRSIGDLRASEPVVVGAPGVEGPAVLAPDHVRRRQGHRDAAGVPGGGVATARGGVATARGVRGDPRRAGRAVRARRADGQLLARLQRRAGAAVRRVAAVQGRGPVPGQQHPAVVAGQVRGRRARAVQVRRRRPGPGRAGALLPPPHRGAPPAQGAHHRAGPCAGPPDHGRLHGVPARDVRAAARRAGDPDDGGGEEAAAAADPPRALPAVRERAGDQARGGVGGVRGDRGEPARRRARGGDGADGELARRAAGRARRRADERGLPPRRRRGDPGGSLRAAGAHGADGLRRARGGHGPPVPGVRRGGGGEHAAGDAGAGAPGDQGPGGHPPQRVGQGRRVLPREAGRAHRRQPLRAHACAGHGPPAAPAPAPAAVSRVCLSTPRRRRLQFV